MDDALYGEIIRRLDAEGVDDETATGGTDLMTTRIFLQTQDGELEDMHEEPYSSESVLQSLLESHPSLLAGDQMNPSHPREWILIAREMDVPGEADAHGRWSLDHLFLDQEGIPTLVEVKRSTNTEIRRKVVGQMLDYAANGVLYWPIRRIQSLFEEVCQRNGTSPEDALMELCGDDADPEQFWQTVETNLNAGRIRLVFVADEIPRELRTIIVPQRPDGTRGDLRCRGEAVHVEDGGPDARPPGDRTDDLRGAGEGDEVQV